MLILPRYTAIQELGMAGRFVYIVPSFVSILHKMTKFRPCIDLHSGQVKQIVGGTLTTKSSDLKTNYISKHPAGYFAKLYKDNGLVGAHVIMLGPGNEEAAKEALSAWPVGLQVGGGITDLNAKQWIDWGAERVGFSRQGRNRAD